MNREKFPEKVPFRLTRMMTKAMEVSGIEGNFRSDIKFVLHRLLAAVSLQQFIEQHAKSQADFPVFNSRVVEACRAESPLVYCRPPNMALLKHLTA